MNAELIEWLKKRAREEGDSSRQWAKQFPNGEQASYRAGAANAFVEALEKVESLNKPYKT